MTEAPARWWMKWVALPLAIAVIGSVTSCVYFNTYYNAEKYFRQAEKARAVAEELGDEGAVRGRNRTQYITLYDKAVRKASIVLEKYPDSDLVDDAMFVAGRALYWQRDYQYAMRSFQDLEDSFPESEYVDRARLWRGLSLMALGQSDDARVLLSELVREGSQVGDRAGMRLSELAIASGDRPGAIAELRRTLEAFGESPLTAQLWLRIADVNIDIGGPARLDSAMAASDRALASSPADSVRYRANLNRGRVQYLQGQPDAALDTYRRLLSKAQFRAWEGETRILIGRYYSERELLDEALSEFERVRDDFPQTAVSAMALYETGLLYLQKKGQRERAQEYFAEVSSERRGSEADSLAKVIQGTCAELDGLIEQIWIADSTAAAILHPASPVLEAESAATDSGRIADIDTVAFATADTMAADVDTVALGVADTIAADVDTVTLGMADTIAADVDTVALEVAGTIASNNDTAKAAGDTVASATPGRVAKLPLASRGYVPAVDSTGKWLPLVPRPGWRDVDRQETDRDPSRTRRPQPRRPKGSSTLEEHLFMAAELYRDQLMLPDSAAVVYQAIAGRFPTSDQRSRALYSLAWIHFGQLGDALAARPYLEQLVQDYGTSAHANAARRLLELPLVRTAEEQAEEAFRGIERLKSDSPDQPETWVAQLDELSRDYPGTITAARAAFLAAWATENVADDSVGAEVRYDSVATRFPRSEYADLVKRRRRSQKDGMLAKMERELKTLGKAIAPAERLFFISVEPDSLDSTSLSRKYLGFAMRAHRREQFEQAEEYYQISLDEQQGRNGNAHAGLGDVAWRQGYFEDAIDHLRTALKERASSLLPQYRLFQYHLQKSQADSANHYLRQITRRDRDNPDALAVIDRFPTVSSAEPENIEIDLLETINLEPADDNLRLPVAFFNVVEPPLVRSSLAVEYPSGGSDSVSVIVDVLVTSEGRADSVRVYIGDEPFASEAVRAVEGYRFYPAENRREKALNVWVEVALPFAPPTEPAAASATPTTSELTPEMLTE